MREQHKTIDSVKQRVDSREWWTIAFVFDVPGYVSLFTKILRDFPVTDSDMIAAMFDLPACTLKLNVVQIRKSKLPWQKLNAYIIPPGHDVSTEMYDVMGEQEGVEALSVLLGCGTADEHADKLLETNKPVLAKAIQRALPWEHDSPPVGMIIDRRYPGIGGRAFENDCGFSGPATADGASFLY